MITVEAILLEATSPVTWMARVPNGHRVAVHFSKKTKFFSNPLLPGEKVLLQMSACDMSRGEIISLRRSNPENVVLETGRESDSVFQSGFFVPEEAAFGDENREGHRSHGV